MRDQDPNAENLNDASALPERNESGGAARRTPARAEFRDLFAAEVESQNDAEAQIHEQVQAAARTLTPVNHIETRPVQPAFVPAGSPERAVGSGSVSAAGPAAAAAAAPVNPRRILVLGATSRIAEATCRLWAAQGARLFLVARNAEKLQAVAQDLAVRGAWVDTAVADLDQTDQHPAMLAHAINSLGGMDIAYLAHGMLGDQAAGEADFEVAAHILHTNFMSAVSLLTWLANYCVTRHSGTLAVLSSVAGERGRKSNYLYGASKAGLTAFLAGLRNRVDREGVHVVTIKPGPVRTAMTAGMKGQEKFAPVESVAREIVRAIDRGTDVLYTPIKWMPIMFVIRHIPERIFKKLNL